MKKFYRKLKGWKKFWFWVITLVLVINFFQLVEYTFEKTSWNYFMNNKEISLLTKIVFPSSSIISGSEDFGFVVPHVAPFYGSKPKYFNNFDNFSEYWKHHTETTGWLQRTATGFIASLYMYVAIIAEWCFFVLWMTIIKILFWEFFVKGFLIGFFLSGWWLR